MRIEWLDNEAMQSALHSIFYCCRIDLAEDNENQRLGQFSAYRIELRQAIAISLADIDTDDLLTQLDHFGASSRTGIAVTYNMMTAIGQNSI